MFRFKNMIPARVHLLVLTVCCLENSSFLSALPVSTWDSLKELDYCPFEPYQAYEVNTKHPAHPKDTLSFLSQKFNFLGSALSCMSTAYHFSPHLKHLFFIFQIKQSWYGILLRLLEKSIKFNSRMMPSPTQN
jgi:hypothetical protein